MPHLALMMLQVASATTAPPPPPAPLSDTATASLLHPGRPGRCSGKADEIVVCGKDANSYRLPQASQQFDVAGPPKAEWKPFGDATGGIGTSQRRRRLSVERGHGHDQDSVLGSLRTANRSGERPCLKTTSTACRPATRPIPRHCSSAIRCRC